MKNSHEDLLNSIRESQELSDEDEERLKDAIQKFNENYEPEETSLVQIGEADNEGGSEEG
jgi:hypothetical protein